ncbi:polymorphic toxin-type HINT domain-containing protein [Nonomuraea sp. NPDC049637]|uniref:polymorphic toxin-type HINT domain-containing protein n=1 Tax=Nonomuraea sp. NPDC049637 TaxID=3154356 RepID=UPI003444FBD1
MADGSYKAIEDVEIGDKVLATDPDTGESSPETVLDRTASFGAKHLVKISLQAAVSLNDDATVVATSSHPFWVPPLKQWVEATYLQVGNQLQTSNGAKVRIQSVQRWSSVRQVYNLTVADIPAYYVKLGNAPVLVHNVDKWRCVTFSGAEQQHFGKWANTTFSVEEGGKRAAMQWHWYKHRDGFRDFGEYTERALDWWTQNEGKGKPKKLGDGTWGIAIKEGNRYGIYTTSGKIVTYAEN